MGSGASKSDNNKITKKDLRFFIKEIKDHDKGINAMCITPDGSMLITASEDSTSRIMDLDTEEVVSVLKGHSKYINAVVCNNDFVFTASADATIRKWRIDTGMCSKTLMGHENAVNRLLLVDTLLFSTSYDRTVRCWHIDTGEMKAVFQGHKLGVYPVLYVLQSEDNLERDVSDFESSPDIIISGSADATAKAWSLKTQENITTYRGHNGAILSMACDNTGKYLFTGSQDNTIRSYNLHSGKVIRVFDGHEASVLQLQVNTNILRIRKSQVHFINIFGQVVQSPTVKNPHRRVMKGTCSKSSKYSFIY